MSYSCFISYKEEDKKYKDAITERLGVDNVTVRVLSKWKDSDNLDDIMRYIRENYMRNTKVTLYLIGEHSSENEGKDAKGDKNIFIKRELQATLYDKAGYKRSGLIGIVLPSMEKKIYKGKEICPICNKKHWMVNINDKTVIKEFSANFYLKKGINGCGRDEDSFCVLVRYCDFMNDPNRYIEMAYKKLKQPIAELVHFRDLR